MHMTITLIVPYAHKWLIIWKERVPNNSLYCLHVAKLRSPVLQPNEQPPTMRSACDFLHIKYLKSSWSSLLCPIIWWRPQDSAASAWHSKICRSCATETPPEGVFPEKIDWNCRSRPSISGPFYLFIYYLQLMIRAVHRSSWKRLTPHPGPLSFSCSDLVSDLCLFADPDVGISVSENIRLYLCHCHFHDYDVRSL